MLLVAASSSVVTSCLTRMSLPRDCPPTNTSWPPSACTLSKCDQWFCQSATHLPSFVQLHQLVYVAVLHCLSCNISRLLVYFCSHQHPPSPQRRPGTVSWKAEAQDTRRTNVVTRMIRAVSIVNYSYRYDFITLHEFY